MTQVIGVITQEYALLASDRRLSYGFGPKKGQLADDDTCKLVSLCNVCGIAYTGLAQLGGVPTHEWIATTLAGKGCQDPASASRILAESAPEAVAHYPRTLRSQTFLMAGWANFSTPPGFRSHLCIISNALDLSGRLLANPTDTFDVRLRAMHDGEDLAWTVVGEPLDPRRVGILERNLKQLTTRECGPREALRLLMQEIVHTSRWLSDVYRRETVGTKVLGFCIPRGAFTRSTMGPSVLLAKQPDDLTPTFAYFDPSYDELEQYGPTVVCGHFAATDIQTENDASRDYQSSQMRILSIPRPPPKK